MTVHTINDARWQHWTDAFLSTPKVRMSGEEADVMLRVLTDTRDLDTQPAFTPELDEKLSKVFPYLVLKAHSKRLGLRMSEAVMVFLVVTSNTPGKLVMYAHALRRLQQKYSLDRVELSRDLIYRDFCNGFLSYESLSVLWDQQKGQRGEGFDNYLDKVVDLDAITAPVQFATTLRRTAL